MSMSTLVLNIKSDNALAQVLCYIHQGQFWNRLLPLIAWTRSIHYKSCTLHTGHWQNIYCNMRSTNCWRDAFLNLHKLQIISSRDKKKLDNTSESAQLVYSLFCTWQVIDETWHDAGQIDVCLLPCGRHWEGSWGSLGPSEVFWPCTKTQGASTFCAHAMEERSKKCVKCCLAFKSYFS